MEAFELYKLHYAQGEAAALGMAPSGVSKAAIYPGNLEIWLPDLTNTRQRLQRAEDDIHALQSQLAFAKLSREIAERETKEARRESQLIHNALNRVMFDRLEGTERTTLRRRYHEHLKVRGSPYGITTKETKDFLVDEAMVMAMMTKHLAPKAAKTR